MECTTTSAPCSIGRSRYGVASVSSTTNGRPWRWATSAIPARSSRSFLGFGMGSPNSTRVSGVMRRAHSSRSRWSSTKSTPDAEPAEVLAEEAAVALVDAARGEDPVAGRQDRQQRRGGRRLAAREEERLGAALELGEASLDLVGGRVAVARVEVALVDPGEPVAGLGVAVEDEAGAEVHGRDAGAVVAVDRGSGVHLARGEAGGRRGRGARPGGGGDRRGGADPVEHAHAPNARREAMAAPSTSAPSFAHATSVATNS